VHGLDSSASGLGQVDGYCKYDNKFNGLILRFTQLCLKTENKNYLGFNGVQSLPCLYILAYIFA
jgi:hypothetical protein